MSNLNWNQLEYFITLAEIQNYTKAASVLNITQPALSRSINNLEQSIGIPLFQKKGRGIELNFYGHIFLQHLQLARDEIYKGENQIRSLISPTKGHIRIGSLYTLGVNLLPPLLHDFYQESPEVTFSLQQQPTRVLHRLLENNEIDLCFCTDFDPEAENDTFMKSIISVEPLYMLVATTHPLAMRKSVKLEEFKDDSFIMFNDLTLFKESSIELFKKAGFEPHIAFEANEDSTVVGFVAAGLGVALIPPVFGVDRTKCVPLKIETPNSYRTLCMAWKKDSNAIPIVNKFRNYVMEWLPQHRNLITPNYYDE